MTPKRPETPIGLNVAFGSRADMAALIFDVCFAPLKADIRKDCSNVSDGPTAEVTEWGKVEGSAPW